MKNTKRLSIWLALFLLFTFLLSGCMPIIKASGDLKVGMQEKWDFSITLVVSSQTSATLVQYLNEQLTNNAQAKQAGAEVQVKQLAPDADGNIPVETTISGKGYDAFRKVFGESALVVDESNGTRILTFNISAFSGGGLVTQSTEFTLSGGKILDHNGTLVNDTTVKWVDYSGTMTAKMQEPSWMDYLLWGVLACGALVVLGVIALIVLLSLMRKKPAPQRAYPQVRQAYRQSAPSISNYPAHQSPIAPIPAQTKFCLQCGEQIPVHATFCPMCGAKQS